MWVLEASSCLCNSRTSPIRIEHYSGHPEVKAAADILVDHVASGKSFLKDRPGWIKARKLVASLWMREGDMFRFGTKKDYFSAGSRKQVWLTQKTLQLFKAMLDLGWVSKAYEAIPPEYAKKQQGGLVTIYCRSLNFRNLLMSLKVRSRSRQRHTFGRAKGLRRCVTSSSCKVHRV